jgi:hypothetical protein
LQLKMPSGRFWQLDYSLTAKRQVALMSKLRAEGNVLHPFRCVLSEYLRLMSVAHCVPTVSSMVLFRALWHDMTTATPSVGHGYAADGATWAEPARVDRDFIGLAWELFRDAHLRPAVGGQGVPG